MSDLRIVSLPFPSPDPHALTRRLEVGRMIAALNPHDPQDRVIGDMLSALLTERDELRAENERLRGGLSRIEEAISSGITETDCPARVKADGDTRIEDGWIVGQFAIQLDMAMKCMRGIARAALAEGGAE